MLDMQTTDEMSAIFVPPTGKYNFVESVIACRYNPAVECVEKKACRKCGWNPAVEVIRRRDARKRVLDAEQG